MGNNNSEVRPFSGEWVYIVDNGPELAIIIEGRLIADGAVFVHRTCDVKDMAVEMAQMGCTSAIVHIPALGDVGLMQQKVNEVVAASIEGVNIVLSKNMLMTPDMEEQLTNAGVVVISRGVSYIPVVINALAGMISSE